MPARYQTALRSAGAGGGTRTPNLFLRTEPLYPLSYAGKSIFGLVYYHKDAKVATFKVHYLKNRG